MAASEINVSWIKCCENSLSKKINISESYPENDCSAILVKAVLTIFCEL